MEQSDISTMQGGRIRCFFFSGEKVTNDPQPSAEPGHVTNYFILKLNSVKLYSHTTYTTTKKEQDVSHSSTHLETEQHRNCHTVYTSERSMIWNTRHNSD
jgi:hypothetical protein